MDYEAARQWRALRAGTPPPPEPGMCYEMPEEYHAREAYLKKYRDGRERFLRGS